MESTRKGPTAGIKGVPHQVWKGDTPSPPSSRLCRGKYNEPFPDSKRTSFSGKGRGCGVDDLGRVANTAGSLGPPNTDVVVLVSQMDLGV